MGEISECDSEKYVQPMLLQETDTELNVMKMMSLS